MNKLLLTLLSLVALAAPAHAALDGWDTKPGDSCTAAEEGHTRRNASADLDGSQITLICDGSQWQSAGGGGLAALQGQDDTGPCTEEKDGLIRYRESGDPHWEYCHGGTTSWLPFRLPQCEDDDTGACTLAALRSSSDPQFKPSSIRCGDKLLGVTGTYGSGSSSAFNFADVTNANPSILTTASAVTISGIPAGCPGEVFVSGQGSPQISVNGGTWGTTGSISNGQSLAVRLTSSPSFSTAHTATISIGSTEDEWSVTTLAADTTPNSFTFADVTGANPSTVTTATAITISGINTSTPVSVTGTGATISINGGSWVTSGTITSGQTLSVRLTSSASFNTAMSATVNVGGVTDSWSVTTRAGNGCTVASGTTWTVSGKTCTTPSALTLAHGASGSRTDSTEPTTGSKTFTCTDGSVGQSGTPTCVESCAASQTVNWMTNCTASSGALLASGANRSITNTASGYDGTRTITCNNGTLDQSGGSCVGTDTTPNAFTFTDLTGQAKNALIASNSITISGINASTPVSVSGDGGPQIRINGGSWATSGTIQNSQTLEVRLTSASTNSTARIATVNVGGVTDAWSVTTSAGAPTRIFITTTGAGSWTVPANWNSSSNTIEVIGGGGGGKNATSAGAAGGGGGAYSKIVNLALTPGANVSLFVGAGGAQTQAGGDTFFNRTAGSTNTCTDTSSVCAKGGGGATSATALGIGGQASASIGSAFSGGTGGRGRSGYLETGGGGGGAGGPNGPGANGGEGDDVNAGDDGGGGGGGASGGSPGAKGSDNGAAGGNNAAGTGGGAGGVNGPGAPGTAGGGGGGGDQEKSGGAGGAGTEWSTHGAGGGGGGTGHVAGTIYGGTGGLYGGGGGGGGSASCCAGAQGIIVITYTP